VRGSKTTMMQEGESMKRRGTDEVGKDVIMFDVVSCKLSSEIHMNG
jgi:hypothetical protein